MTRKVSLVYDDQNPYEQDANFVRPSQIILSVDVGDCDEINFNDWHMEESDARGCCSSSEDNILIRVVRDTQGNIKISAIGSHSPEAPKAKRGRPKTKK